MTVKVKDGVWTPWALVLCLECHGTKFPKKEYDVDSDDWKRVIAPKELDEDNAVTKCHKCGTDIQVYDEVAEEHNIVLALREKGIDAEMHQTGGMNSACAIYHENSKEGAELYWYVTYNMDGDKEYLLGGLYDDNLDYTDEFSFETKDRQEMIDYILKLEVRKING